MRTLILSGLVVLSMFVAGLNPALSQTLEQAKTAQVERALSTAQGKQIKASVEKYSKMYRVDKNLIYAIILTESGFRQYAGSNAGCKGLMQLAPLTFKARKVGNNIYDIDQNIHAGVKHFAGMLGRYKGNTYLSLSAYNAGGGRVPVGGPMPSYSRKYVNRVMYHKYIIEKMKL